MIKKITNCFKNGETSTNSIMGAAFVIAFMGLISRFLGLIRDRILASKFGAGDELDIYYAAFKIPDLVFNLLILGALSAAFVPVFTSLISQEQKKKAWELTDRVITLAISVLLLVAVVLYFIAPFLVELITFGFNDGKQASVVVLTRIMLISPVLMGLSGIFGGILNSFKKFLFYSLAPVFYNLGIIFGALVFTEFWGLKGLAWGVVLGAFLHLAIQFPETLRCGLRFKPNFNFKDKQLRQVIKLMIPRMMGLSVVQVNFLVVTILASTLQAGSLAIFNLANNIQSVPLGLFGISFAIAAFPTLSCVWAQNRKDEFIQNFSKTFRNITFFIIPMSVVFIVLRAQIVRVVLGTGRFDWEDTILTFQALGIFSLSLFAQGLIPLLARSFYAIQNTMTPFFVGLSAEAVNLVLALLLIDKYGILGLVFAFTAASIVNMLLLLVILRKKVGSLGEREIIRSTWKIVIATVFMAVFMQITKYGASYAVNMETFLGVFSQMTAAAVVGLAVFFVVGKIINIKEMNGFISSLKRRLPFRQRIVYDEDIDEIGGIK